MVTVTRRSGAEYTTNVANASVRSDFYSFDGADGDLDDTVERWFGSEIEGPGTKTLRLASAGVPPCIYSTKPIVRFVAAGLARTPAVRSKMNEIDEILRPHVVAQVLDRHKLLIGPLRNNPIGSLSAYSPDSQELTRSRLRTMLRVFEELAARLVHYRWSVATCDEPSLITSDSAIATEGQSDLWEGIIPQGAKVFMPVSPQSLLLGEPLLRGPIRRHLKPELATYVNLLLAESAHDSLFRHPAMPMPADISLAPSAPTLSAATTAALRPTGATTPGTYRAEDPTVAGLITRLNEPDVVGR